MTTYKFPKTMGGCADRIYELRNKRLTAQKLVTEIEEEEKALKEHIIQTLPKSEASGVAGKCARVTVITKEVPQVKDWDAFYKHIKKTGDFDLLNRAVSKSGVEARWDAGKKVPGVVPFELTKLSINKV
jgi:hypothetical protein